VKAQNPDELYGYLHLIYYSFHKLTNPLGGESRDISADFQNYNINIVIIKIFDNIIREINTHFIATIPKGLLSTSLGALLRTCQLDIEKVPSSDSKLYRYIEQYI